MKSDKILNLILVVVCLFCGYFLLFYKKDSPINASNKIAIENKISPKLEIIFKKAQDEKKDIILFFVSPACQPCESMKKEIANDRVQKELEGFVFAQIDAIKDEIAAETFKIRVTPTLVMINNDGRRSVEKVQTGLMNADAILAFLKKDKMDMPKSIPMDGAKEQPKQDWSVPEQPKRIQPDVLPDRQRRGILHRQSAQN